MRNHIFVLAAILLAPFGALAQDAEQKLDALDKALSAAQTRSSNVENSILDLRRDVQLYDSSPALQYDKYKHIYDISYAYQFNTAMEALEKMEGIALRLKDSNRLAETRINKALLYCTAGYYLESAQEIQGIDTLTIPQRLLPAYYDYQMRFSREVNAQGEGRKGALLDKSNYFAKKLMDVTNPSDFLHTQTNLIYLIENGYFEKADSVARAALRTIVPRSHQYAILSYWLANANERMGNDEESLLWYIESSLADVVCATKDNASLFSLAQILLDRGDVERAFRYTQIALDDALFYNSKLRPLQIATKFQEIEQRYSEEREAASNRLILYIYIIGILAIVLFVMLLVTVGYHRRLSKTTSALSEESAAKEEYLALFLSMSSSYLEKLRHHLSRAEMEEELKSFYNAFDNAFIQLYPDFVEQFNMLLVPEERVELKKGELLNTELRIFALIRLGIDQSSHIASLLRYSVNTIYNYRAKIKGAAINGKENFEDQVKRIGKRG